jgi:hypothetical protein
MTDGGPTKSPTSDDDHRSLPLSRIRHCAPASMVAVVRQRVPTRADLPILSRSTLRSLTPRKEEALDEAKKRIDRVLSNLDSWLS